MRWYRLKFTKSLTIVSYLHMRHQIPDTELCDAENCSACFTIQIFAIIEKNICLVQLSFDYPENDRIILMV